MGYDDYDPDDLYESTEPATIQKWLEACEEAAEVPLHRGGTAFSVKEREFIESLREQFDERQTRRRPLSGKQLVWLRSLYDRT
jgi:hypothetical protein